MIKILSKRHSYNGQPYSILEILPDPGETNDGTITKLTAADIKDKIVILYIEILENTIYTYVNYGDSPKYLK